MARDITKLHPKVQDLANQLVTKCKAQGLIIKITDCVRTEAEQTTLYAKGRTDKTSGIVTNAKYPQSYHCWGIAFDFCRNDGKGAYEDKDGFFTKVGKIGESLGLTWGGSWTRFVDKPHFQLDDFGTYTQLITRYKNPSNYFKCWDLKKPLNVVTPTSSKDDIMWLQHRLNESIGAGLVVDGGYGKLTAGAVKKYYTFKRWESPTSFTGLYVGMGTIKSLT